MGTSKIKSLEELVAGGTKIHFFDSNDGYEITVDTTFAKELIQKYHLCPTLLCPTDEQDMEVKEFFTYVNKEGRHFAILFHEWIGEEYDDIGYFARWFQVIET